MKLITKVVVGSRLHGLANEDSDWDFRGIHMHKLCDVISPFKKLKNTSWIEGDEDNTSYELADFCKQAVHGNATILEVFFSNQIKEDSRIAQVMRENWKEFIDTDKFVMASRGYAHNQYNKMQLFEGPGIKSQDRTPKFAVAYLRVLWQCWQFLETGEFKCQVEGEWKDIMLTTKNNFSPEMVPKLTERFIFLQQKITEAWANPKLEKLTPNISWIEQFVYDAYMGVYDE
jgi:predicted nucleotidyltransferase